MHLLIISEWCENEYVSNCSIIPKKELFYTSWWQIENAPKVFYMYQFTNAAQAKAIRNLNKDIPISLLSNIISTFDNKLNFVVPRENDQVEVLPENSYTFSLNDILFGFESISFPLHRDVENHFKRLLYCVVSNLFRKKGLFKYEMSNKRLAYYLPKYEGLKK